jgi:signal transduction histidine kinase/streptogramin lyase
MLEDSQGNLWFGTETGGVNLFDGQSFRHFTEKEGLSNNAVNAILEDSQGNLWFATEYGGVSIYNGKSFTHFTEEDGLSDPRIRSILEDSQGNIWFGPWTGGVSLFTGGTIRHFGGTEGFCDDPVNTVFEDSQDRLWFGTYGGGVIRFDGITFTHYTEKNGLGNDDVRSVLEDSRGNMWFGTWGAGVTMYDGHTFTHYTEKEGLGNNNVRSILEDQQGNLWLGTYGGGVSRLSGETITLFTEKEGLSDNIVLSVMEDSRGQIWFGTYGGGVSILEGETITHFTEKEGLSNNIVQSVLEGSPGNYWVSTERGLNLIVFEPDGPGAERRPRIIWNFGLQDGLMATDFILNCAMLDSQNRIWWGSSKSLTMLDMHHFKIPDDPPEMQLNDVVINDQFTDYKNLKGGEGMELEFDEVTRFYNCPVGLELPYKNNHLTFHFSAIDWSAPHKIKYSYRIEGLYDQWSLPSPESFADYRKLPHGEYTFKVRAIGGAHSWSEVLEYSFTITPPWWSTILARIAYGLAVLMTVLGLIRWRTSYLMRQRKELEVKVAESIHQIREQKEEIESQRDEVLATNKALEDQKRELQFTLENLKMTQSQLIQSEKMASVGLLTAGIAHELNNPINFIRGNVNPLKRDLNDLFQFIQKYDEILKVSRLDEVINEVDALKIKLDYGYLLKEIMNLLEGIEEGASRSSQIVKGLRSFSRMDEEKSQLYDIHEGIDSTLILLQNKLKNRIKVRKEYGDFEELECYPSKLNQVFLNILNNSIQAIEGKGEILIQTVRSGIGIKIIIKDSGKGMTPEVKKQIFDPFFTTKEVGEGTGLGLSISYGIIEMHEGNIDVISEPGKGTEFIISLPLTQSDK